MRAAAQAFLKTGAGPVRTAWPWSDTGEAASVAAATGRAPLLLRSGLLRTGATATAKGLRTALTVAAAGLGVVASALVFAVVSPHDSAPPRPAQLSGADAAAVHALVARAERLVSVTPRQLGYTLRVAGPVPGLRGQTDTARRTITLFVAPRDVPDVVAHDLGHELGHAFDAQRLSAADRAAYLRARGAPTAPWLPGRASDYRSGAGDFAEVFALCHATSPLFRSRLAGRPEDPCGALPKQARSANLAGGGS
jgi:hypothetical protein